MIMIFRCCFKYTNVLSLGCGEAEFTMLKKRHQDAKYAEKCYAVLIHVQI